MEKKTIIVDVQTDEGVKSLNRLEASFEDVYGEIQPLTGRIGELEDQLYEMAAAGQQGTKEFQQLANQVGKMKKTILEVDMEVDGLSMTMGQKLGGSIGGLAGGFELAQGAMGAFGVESAKVEEALLKVNSAMAIAQGVQSVKESIPAFKALNAVIMANPIAAVVTAFIALGAAAVAWASTVSTKVVDAFKKQGDAAESYRKNLAKANEEQNKNTEKALESLDREAKKRIAMGEDSVKVQKEINAAKIKELEIAIQQDKAAIRALNAQKEKLKLTQQESKEQLAQQVRQEYMAWAGSVTDIQKAIHLKRIAELGEQIKEIDKESNQQMQEINAQLTARNSELESQKDAVEDLKISQIELNKEQGQKSAEARKVAADAAKEEAQAMKEFADSLNDALSPPASETDSSGLLPPPDVVAEEMDAIVEVAAEKFTALDHIQMNWSNNFKETFDRTIGFAADGLGAIQELADAFAGKSEESQRRAFKVRKAAAIAQTTIETYKAAQSAYASQIIAGDPTSPIRGAIAATIAVASGLAKVKSIASQKFEGGGSASGGGTGAPSLPQPTAANFNIVGNSGTNQIVEGLTSAPVQAYVVSGEVTSAQSLDRNRIKTATL